ncbi:MAG: ribosome maturation factor RimP [Proteobacteria bacterium]|nr:ribosome maturation factor RimP [Pseudomonadota bacterium]
MQPLEHKIWQMIAPGVDDLGLRLVRVRLSGGENTSSTLQVMIEPATASRTNRVSVTVDDCEKVSRMVSALMDVEDPLPDAYTLEVSSTGLERPLVLAEDFAQWAPHRVKLELSVAHDGRKRFVGLMEGLEDGDILFRQDGQEEVQLRLPYEALKTARIVYTDDEFKKLFNN